MGVREGLRKKAVQNEDILFDSQFNKGLFESYNFYVKVRGVRALITVWACVQGVLVSPVALILLSFRLLDPNISEALVRKRIIGIMHCEGQL